MTEHRLSYFDLPSLLASLPPSPPLPQPFVDLTLDGVLSMLAAIPRIKPVTIVVTRYVYGGVVVEDARQHYILCDQLSIDKVIQLCQPIQEGQTVVSYAAIPVVYDDDLARDVILAAAELVRS